MKTLNQTMKRLATMFNTNLKMTCSTTQTGIRVEDNEQFGTHTVGQVAVRYFATPKTSYL